MIAVNYLWKYTNPVIDTCSTDLSAGKRRGYRVFNLYRHGTILNARMELIIGGSELLGHASVIPMMDEMNINIG